MLKHAGMLEPQPSMIPTWNKTTSAELQWRAWLHREAQNRWVTRCIAVSASCSWRGPSANCDVVRMVYNWVMIDQELSLFHDVAPLLSVTDLLCPLPGPEALWMSPNSERWLTAVQSVYGCTANVNPQLLAAPSLTPSLCDLFQDFLHDNLSHRQNSLSPHQLRLLLHPIQALLNHLGQLLSCFTDVLSTRRAPARSVSKSSTQERLEEVQTLLQKWFELAIAYHDAHPECPVTRCNIIMYHLLSLNAVTSFPECERLARKEGFDGTHWELSLRHRRCIFQSEEAVFHCGQVFRLLRAMPQDRRPNWWSAALYRATLILWVDSACRLDPNFQPAERADAGRAAPGSSSAPVAIDQVLAADPAIIAYMWNGDGVAVLTGPDGAAVTLDQPAAVLAYSVRQIESGFSCRIADGIKRKLIALGKNWNGVSV